MEEVIEAWNLFPSPFLICLFGTQLLFHLAKCLFLSLQHTRRVFGQTDWDRRLEWIKQMAEAKDKSDST